ncbi:MAG: NAD(P)-dependent oxidoreductase [Candidatus Omnitrophota bacterium]|jgi:nucleoside-diphosphate-sugar epimerase
MKKILVTGSQGFIGRHLLPLLIEKGYEVHAVSLLNDQSPKNEIVWHQADLLNTSDIEALMQKVKPTHLLHLAWYTEHKKYWTAQENYDWVQASLFLARTFQKYGGIRVVAAGTCAEYDWTKECCDETATPLAPATVYGRCKNEFRRKLEEFSLETHLSWAWGRIFFVYGPGEHPARLVPSVICSLLQGKEVACSSGSQKRDFLYVEDVAGAFVSILESTIEGAVNIGSGEAVSIKDIIGLIAGKVGRPALVKFGLLKVSPDEPSVLIASVKRLKDQVNWSPKFSMNEALDKTIAWWKLTVPKG